MSHGHQHCLTGLDVKQDRCQTIPVLRVTCDEESVCERGGFVLLTLWGPNVPTKTKIFFFFLCILWTFGKDPIRKLAVLPI